MNFFSRLILRHAGWVLFLGFIATAVAGNFAIELFKNLRTDIEELLPTTARSVIDLNEVTSRLESTDNLSILVFSKNTAESKKFVIALAERLEKFPRDVVAGVEYRIDQELNFFNRRRALYMELEDLLQVRDYVKARIAYEKELYNPLTIFGGKEIPEPILDFYKLKKKYESRVSSYSRFPGGFYANPDETIRVVLVNLPGKLSGIDGAHRLRAAVDQAIAELNPKSFAPDLEVKFTGGVQNLIEEHAALIADLTLSTVVVSIIVTIAMWLFYKSAAATWALVLSLFMGTFWTFGVSYFAVGYLNANSAFLGSIVIGNGINFGIIFLARYMEERRRGRGNVRSIHLALTRTVTSTWTAALAAGLSYGSLALTGFRGFKQFGIIGLIGMVLCWLSAYTLLPAFLTVFDRIRPIVRVPMKETGAFYARWLASLIEKYPGKIWIASMIITAISIFSLTLYSNAIIETNLANLRDKRSMEEGSAFNSRYQDEVFRRYLSPIVVLPHSLEDARKIASLLKEEKKKDGEDSLLHAILSMDDFLPQDQEAKIANLKLIRDSLSPRILRHLGKTERELVSENFTPEAFQGVRPEDLPPLVRSKFTEKDGSMGKLVLVEPPLDDRLHNGDTLIDFVKRLRTIADSVQAGTAVAGQLPVTSDMYEAIRRDGPIATAFAFLSVIILVVLLFRNFRSIFLTLFALLLGVGWLIGCILIFNLKINFLNFIALPITFGIGVDYGVNIFQRYRQEGRGRILSVLKHTGGAVGLASFTTIVGYGSLLIAGNQAFVSFGTLAVLGELTCIVAALISLPAFLCYRDQKRGIIKASHDE